MLIQIVAYSTFMRTNIFTGDDWNFAYNGYAQLNGAFEIGRWFSGLIWMSLDKHSFAPVFSHLVAFSIFACAGILLARLWRIENLLVAGLVAAMISIFPFNSDIITFHIRHFSTTSGVLLSILGAGFLIFADKRPRYYLYACIALVLSYAIYQSHVSNALVVLMFAAVFRLLDGDRDSAVFKDLVIQFMVVLVSVVVYFITFKISLEITGVDITNKKAHYNIESGNIKSIGNLVDNFIDMLATTKGFFTHRSPFFPLITKQIFVLMVIYVIVMMMLQKTLSVKQKLLALLLAAGISFAPWSTSLIRAEFTARASMLYSFAIIYAGVIVLAYRLSNREQLKKLIIAASVFMIVVFTFQMTKSGYYREMQWMFDNNLAARITARIEDEGLVKKARIRKNRVPIYVNGRIRKEHRPFTEDIANKKFFTNTSRDGVTDSQIIRFAQLMNLHSAEKNFITAKKHMVRKSTKQKIKEMPRWPAKGSVDVINGIVVVNLSHRKLQ